MTLPRKVEHYGQLGLDLSEEEPNMRTLLFAASLAGTATFGMWASPSIAQDNVDQQFGTSIS
jgi:hypothetical protein